MTSDLYSGEQPVQRVETVMDSRPQRAPEVKPTSAWVQDLSDLHQKFGVNPIVREFDKEKLQAFLDFRIRFLQEELTELVDSKTADDAVDALIDLCVVAIGTLDAFDVKSDISWDRVHAANMTKESGVKASRPNPLSLPDMIKGPGWQAPVHHDNCGLFDKIYPK